MLNEKFKKEQIEQIVNEFGTPIYIYDENTIIEKIQDLQNLTSYNYKVNYAVKANSNPQILKICHEHGLEVDAIGIGEIYINEYSGYNTEQIHCVGNNYTKDELKEIAQKNVTISLDSLDQIKMLGQVAAGYDKVLLRVNPIKGAGENDNIITAGSKTKFGIDPQDFKEAQKILQQFDLKLIGVNQHIGSSYLDYKEFLQAVKWLLDFIHKEELNDLQIINFGGGFGVNYQRKNDQNKFDFSSLKVELDAILEEFTTNYPRKDVVFKFEPGRYIVAESGILVGKVTSLKERNERLIIGTDIGFNKLIRPTLYDSYHEIELLSPRNEEQQLVDIVGNVCESGDYLGKERHLAKPNLEDLIVIDDVGAYGYVMASNYNSSLRPAEVLITKTGEYFLIRRRETLEDLTHLL